MRTDCRSTVLQVTTALKSAGCQVVQSFDLHSAMTAHDGCDCNPVPCTCQMVVLLVYAQEGPPNTLIVDSDDSQSIVYLANNFQQSAYPAWVEKITQLSPDNLSSYTPTISLVE